MLSTYLIKFIQFFGLYDPTLFGSNHYLVVDYSCLILEKVIREISFL
jgi:hypothetical protein